MRLGFLTAFAILFCTGSTLLVGCASILDGNKQSIYIDAQVEKADVYLDQKFVGETPVSVEVPRGDEVVLEIRKDHYQTRKVKLKAHTNPYFWLNFPLPVLGTTGMSTDYGTGSMYEYKPDNYLVELKAIRPNKNSESETRLKLYRLTNGEQIRSEWARHTVGEATASLNYLENVNKSQNGSD